MRTHMQKVRRLQDRHLQKLRGPLTKAGGNLEAFDGCKNWNGRKVNTPRPQITIRARTNFVFVDKFNTRHQQAAEWLGLLGINSCLGSTQT